MAYYLYPASLGIVKAQLQDFSVKDTFFEEYCFAVREAEDTVSEYHSY